MEAGGKETFEGSAIFPTAWFSERQHALDWSRAITPSRTLGEFSMAGSGDSLLALFCVSPAGYSRNDPVT
jgi:hypothetical protein